MNPIKQLLLLSLVATACGKDSVAPEPPANPGKMRVQITGAAHLTSEWIAFGEFRDILATTVNDLSLMSGQNQQPALTDSSFTLLFPGRFDVGQFAIGRYTPGVIPSGPAAYVVLDSAFFVSLPGGTITVDTADYPARPGLTFGQIRGTLTFRAVRLVSGPGGPVETTDIITVHATFAAHWGHYLYPNVSVTLSGASPVVGTSQFATGQSVFDDHGGRFVEWSSDFTPTHTFPHDISTELRILAPSVGTFTLASTTPTQFADTSLWPAIYAALFYRDDPRLGLSTGGTLTITQLIEPTNDFEGEIHGTLTAPMALWTNSTTLSGDTANMSVTFAVQLWPFGGIPAVPPLPSKAGPSLRALTRASLRMTRSLAP